MQENSRAEMQSTPARRAMYYTNAKEMEQAREAIGDAWIRQMEDENYIACAAILGYLAGLADGKKAERAKNRRPRGD